MIFLKLNADKTNPNRLNKCIQLLDIFWKSEWKTLEGVNKTQDYMLWRGLKWQYSFFFLIGDFSTFFSKEN